MRQKDTGLLIESRLSWVALTMGLQKLVDSCTYFRSTGVCLGWKRQNRGSANCLAGLVTMWSSC
jgi:hypothetical protein